MCWNLVESEAMYCHHESDALKLGGGYLCTTRVAVPSDEYADA